MQLLTTGFGIHSTAAEVAAGIDLTGKRAIVTGGSSGIGLHTAYTLAAHGAEVTIAVRSKKAGQVFADEIIAATGNQKVYSSALNLYNRKSIKEFTASWKGHLNILINNAGVMAIPELELNEDGWEMHFAANYMGHFELTLGLYQALASAQNSRVVAVSSSSHLLSPVIFDDINFNFRSYDPWIAYGQSKTAIILFAVAANKRWSRDGITINALNPGMVATDQHRVGADSKTAKELQKTPEQAAATTILLATSPLLESEGGHYFENCNEAAIVTKRPADYHGTAPYALDIINADRLWQTSMNLLSE
jgi:NAD(P)-dependent dehydrogenase (short-subunit alcohol dehydrogenase family)